MGKVKNSIKKEFDSEPKTDVKFYNGKINTNFYNNKIPNEDSQFICLSVISIDRILEQVKIIILKCFWKNVNILLKEEKDTKVHNNI